jgi:hypothetical protein
MCNLFLLFKEEGQGNDVARLLRSGRIKNRKNLDFAKGQDPGFSKF